MSAVVPLIGGVIVVATGKHILLLAVTFLYAFGFAIAGPALIALGKVIVVVLHIRANIRNSG